MPESEPHNHDTNGDPVVTFPTDAEIAIADQLRHRLEERLLARSHRKDAGIAEPAAAIDGGIVYR